jgi:hypothetical protein
VPGSLRKSGLGLLVESWLVLTVFGGTACALSGRVTSCGREATVRPMP